MIKGVAFHDYVVYDLLVGFPGIISKPMFGGYGIYKDGEIFAIIVGDELYFKGREDTEEFFRSHESRQFIYSKKDGKNYAMNYWIVPVDVYENRDALAGWIDIALSKA